LSIIKYPKKLIEVALPLDDINEAAAREKSIRHGHPSTLHLWWAPRPLAAARAVLFAQMVNDPGGERGWGAYPGQSKSDAQRERDRLFNILRQLVQWENTSNEEILEKARVEIRKSWVETCKLTGEDPSKLPALHDPFAGGGAIPLEAQRLGLESFASDLNPVAVLINKAKIEIPHLFAGNRPVGPILKDEQQQRLHEEWTGAQGLAEDVRRYGSWLREESFKRVGHLYPLIEITADMAKERADLKPLIGQKLTVIAWHWARTVKSPNPAYSHVEVPLVSTFILSTKAGKEVYVEPLVENDTYRFTVKMGKPKNLEQAKSGTKLARGANFQCLVSNSPIDGNYIKAEGQAGRMGARLMAIVAEGKKGRIYLSPIDQHEKIAQLAVPKWKPETPLPHDPRAIWTPSYGLTHFYHLFTPRQLATLTTFSDLVAEVQAKVHIDALAAGWQDDGRGLANGGTGAKAYSEAIGLYLALSIDKAADYNSSLVAWSPTRDQLKTTFSRQGLPMVWDYSEANSFAGAAGDLSITIEGISRALIGMPATTECGYAVMMDAQSQRISAGKIVSTDPPYYDNIGYADLSDFFYVWLRRTLRSTFPDLLATIAVPKSEELVATPYRHGSKETAEAFFLAGMTKTMANLTQLSHPAFPVTIYYAFKQSETKEAGTSSTGWETFLEAVIRAGFAISGTWPMRTERSARSIGIGSNALASSIILVCRKRLDNAATVSRKQFIRELERVLPEALEAMIGGEQGASPIAPVDLAQASIGPGMAVFSKYAGVIEADGSPMTVHNALILINKAIDEYFTHAESDMDGDTRFCVDWFQQFGFKTGAFGEADVLARAKGTSVDGVRDAGVVESKGGNVRLLKVNEYPAEWDPTKDDRTPIWEACHQMCRALQESEASAGALLGRMPEKAEPIRQLAYRLYTLCERKGWAEEARAYNELIVSWHAIVEASHEVGRAGEQMGMEF
jgi:putative DNA methylase